MNPVVLLTRNNLELTKRCVESVLAQDVPTDLCVFDNASSDETVQWSRSVTKRVQAMPSNVGVSVGWNFFLRHVFDCLDARHVLVLNNDVALPIWFLRRLLSLDLPFVTGVSVGNMEEIAEEPPVKELMPCPDFSGFLIRRDAWQTIGPFDEALNSYCGDLDYHIRAHRKGIRLLNAGIPFFHERSSTINNASPKDKRVLQLQADADRQTFFEKWGVAACSPEYDAMFNEATFAVDRDTITA